MKIRDSDEADGISSRFKNFNCITFIVLFLFGINHREKIDCIVSLLRKESRLVNRFAKAKLGFSQQMDLSSHINLGHCICIMYTHNARFKYNMHK
jgi:hypothetical protein